MKLLVILLCLASERYLVHAASLHRYQLFRAWFRALTSYLPKARFFTNPFLVLAWVILPALLIVWAILALTDDFLFGFIGLLFNLLIFYFCLGPDNSFYPANHSNEGDSNRETVGNYFSIVNSQLFAVIFWYILTGPIGVLFYRLLYIGNDEALTQRASKWLTGFPDWITARVTLLLYLLVGNFQQGFHYYTQMFFSSPDRNNELLVKGGTLAAQTRDEELSLPYAQSLVEHALIVFLVFLAFFTLVAWL